MNAFVGSYPGTSSIASGRHLPPATGPHPRRHWAQGCLRRVGLRALVRLEASLEREFEERLADSSTVAFRVAYSVLRQREDAEDVAQEAFVRAYRGFRSLRERDRFRAWLVRIVWRLALDRQRANRRREKRELAAGNPTSEPTVETLAVSRERQQRVWCAIDELPRKLKEVVVLASIEGQNIREVATLLNLPEGTVKSRLHAARKTLLEKLR